MSMGYVARSFFPSGTCDYCDLEEKERLSRKLLEAISVTSLAFDQKFLSEATLNHMKNRLMMSLELGASCSPSLDYDIALERLTNFPKHALDGGKNRWVREVSEGGIGEYEKITIRSAEINRFWFTQEERMEVAELLIQRHDHSNKFHCNTVMCGEQCEFAIVVCENENCGTLLSKKWVAKHDMTCVHKVVPCTRSCGEVVPRRLMESHLNQDCDLRPVQCTFSDLGCQAGVLVVI